MGFKRIKAQAAGIHRLKQIMREGRLAGAYLFSGPKGIGKSLLALELAKAINCESNSDDACDICSSCLRIEKNQHPDVHIIDSGQSQINIESIRQLQKEINLKPYEARKKVFIVPEAHLLNPASASCLLKTLEEPAANSLILLVSDKPVLLLKTIVSRCQVIKFSALLRRKLEDTLSQDYALSREVAHFLAYFCEGRIGKALALKDCDILAAKNQIIDSALSAKASLKAVSLALENFSGIFSSRPTGHSRQDRGDLRSYLNILLSWFRDMYLVKAGAQAQELINLDRKDELERVARRASFADIEAVFGQISSFLLYLEQNVNTRLLLAQLKYTLAR